MMAEGGRGTVLQSLWLWRGAAVCALLSFGRSELLIDPPHCEE